LRRGAGAVETLPVGATSLRLRYHDGTEWASSFDARERGRLPTAVEVRITMAPASAESSPAGPTMDERLGSATARDAVPEDDFDPPMARADERAPMHDDPPTSAGPMRRRVIVIPDAAPAELMPATTRSDR